LSLILASGMAAGCRASPLLNPYANAVDDINDTHVYFDNWYNPKWDISRAGKPDWCSPMNQRLGGNVCYLGCYDRYDDCNLYPPANPYSFPSNTMPAPKDWTPGTAADTTDPINSQQTPPEPSPGGIQ
jgi:hypothetical protein